MSQYFNLGKFAVQKGPKLVKEAIAPITHAKNVIKSFFKKDKKPKIGGTKKSDRIKEAVKIKKNVQKLEKSGEEQIKKYKGMVGRSDLVGPTKNLRDIKRTKRDAEKFVKETLKQDFKKGGRAGFKLGKKVEKKNGKKFPDLTGDGKVTFADILKGRGVINGKKKKKAI